MMPQDIVSLLKLDSLVDELERKSDFEARIQITLQAIQDTLPLDVQCEQKDNEESRKLRKQADKLIIKQKSRFVGLIKAWELYCKCIAKAKESSLELALAYGNRSSVLFHLKFHNECIRDINRALQLSSYPDHFRVNLTRRKAKCLKLLGNPESEKICEEARSLLESLNLNDEAKELLEEKISRVAETTSIHEHELKDCKLKEECSFKFDSNKCIPSASDAICIKYTKEFGKHLIADRDIEAGEILIVEKPYASLLHSKNIYSHCSHCFVRSWDIIPCEYCVYAMYCSENCKNEAWKQYHDIECLVRGYLESLSIQGIGLFSLKLAILAVRESGSIKNLKKDLKKVDQYYIMKCLSDGIYRSDKYKALYNLEGHESVRNRPEILTISLNTAFILHYLFTLTSFFGDNSDADILTLCKNKDVMFFGKLIACHATIIQINDHEFVEFRDNEYEGIGSVIGPVASLLNHSCNPNINRCTVMKDQTMQQVFYAICPIKQGSQIFDDYGCHFAFHSKTQREDFLKKYFFKCSCLACVEIWPLFDELPSILTLVREKEAKLSVVRAIVRSKEHQRTISKIGMDKYEGNKMDLLSSLASSITILSVNTKKPNREYYELIELFQQAFYAIFGYKFEVHDPMCIC
ncbi:SET and MYND domain-containing protein 4-like isoform X2 [Phymastichus coffea]|uniref:SET and MYND domain-containing protein 4-like isoform X2 n=1 Tax=Phymastichus coffea TaxID=108790 RepID=UPI00273C97F2|nr:SET and MYND domain-containing protein 4-like isoform X2 [Phymastichus coffea]